MQFRMLGDGRLGLRFFAPAQKLGMGNLLTRTRCSTYIARQISFSPLNANQEFKNKKVQV